MVKMATNQNGDKRIILFNFRLKRQTNERRNLHDNLHN